jgi:hypothetical protein
MPNLPPEAPIIRLANADEFEAAVKRIAELGEPNPDTAEWLELVATQEAVRVYCEVRGLL